MDDPYASKLDECDELGGKEECFSPSSSDAVRSGDSGRLNIPALNLPEDGSNTDVCSSIRDKRPISFLTLSAMSDTEKESPLQASQFMTDLRKTEAKSTLPVVGGALKPASLPATKPTSPRPRRQSQVEPLATPIRPTPQLSNDDTLPPAATDISLATRGPVSVKLSKLSKPPSPKSSQVPTEPTTSIIGSNVRRPRRRSVELMTGSKTLPPLEALTSPGTPSASPKGPKSPFTSPTSPLADGRAFDSPMRKSKLRPLGG